MATINQDPAGQASVTLSGISFNNTTATTSPVHTGSRITVEGGSFAVLFNASTPEPSPTPGPTIPTTGQIWPLGIYSTQEPAPPEPDSYSWVWWD